MKQLILTLLTFTVLLRGAEVSAGEIRNLEEAKPAYENILKLCGATALRFHKDFGILIIITRKIDLSCFHKRLSVHVSARTALAGKIVDSQIVRGAWDNSKVKLITYLSLFAERGGERRVPSHENIIVDKDTFYFVLGNWSGVSTKLVKNNIFHIIIDGSHYDQNYLFNNKDNSLLNLGSGKVKFERDKITKTSVKGYLAKNGGAFWINVNLDYHGRYLELFDVNKFAACYPYKRFANMSEQFRAAFKRQKLRKLCVWHK